MFNILINYDLLLRLHSEISSHFVLADLRVGRVPKAFQLNAAHLVGFYHSRLLIQASLIRSLK
jgi:hypothetical protein